jgi:anti-sigma regulatory factor (Ser/Thr protein kinase)
MSSGIELYLRDGLNGLRSFIRKIINHVNTAFPSCCPETQEDLRLVLSELLYNAIIHGNKQIQGKMVKVIVSLNGNLLSVCIEDEGSGYDHAKVMDTCMNKNDVSNLSESGRGILIAMRLTDKLDYWPPGNKVMFQKYLMAVGG